MNTLTEVKERPILFSTPMIRAILAGEKTVTRRVINPQPTPCKHESFVDAQWRNEPAAWKYFDDNPDEWYCALCGNGVDFGGNGMKCRYGKPGDILWVRETWAAGLSNKEPYAYKATAKWDDFEDGTPGDFKEIKWRPSIFMRKDICRIRLQITSIRVESLHDITEDDAVREGVGAGFQMNGGYPDYTRIKNGVCELTQDEAKMSFATLWESINGRESWETNPFCWRIEFEKLIE